MNTSMTAGGLIAVAVLSMLSACAGEPAATETPAPATVVEPAAAASATTAVVSGRVPVVSGGAPTVVILKLATASVSPPQAATPYMDQVALTFTPALMLVQTGQPSEFRNSDDVLHNVRVREEATREGTFNVALPTGGTFQHTFARDGFYDVGCDIHPGMAALVVAVSTPYAVIADGQGTYRIPDVTPGAYVVTVYAGTQTIERHVEVTAGAFQLDVAS